MTERIRPPRPALTDGDLRQTIIGLSGIFWALDLLHTHKAAEEIQTEEQINEGIACLISAGEILCEEITAGF